MATKAILLLISMVLALSAIALVGADIKDFIIESEEDLRRLSNGNDLEEDDDYYGDEMMYDDACGGSINPMYSMLMDGNGDSEIDMSMLQRLIAEAISNNMLHEDASSHDVGLSCPSMAAVQAAAAAARNQEIEHYRSCMEDGSIPMTEDLFNLL